MKEGARRARVIPWLLGVVLLIEVAGARGLGRPVKALGAAPVFTYDLEQLIDDLQHMTGWDLKGLPRPAVEVLTPVEFRKRVQAPGMIIFGFYKVGAYRKRDLLLLNLECLSKAGLFGLRPKAFCRGTLIHELVHWAQSHRPHQHPKGRIERELEAHRWEQQYLRLYGSPSR